jgi:aspartyl protease family protein
VFDRLILMALTPMTLAGGAIGWTSLTKAPSTLQTTSTEFIALGTQVQAAPRPDMMTSRHLVRQPDGLFYAVVQLNGSPLRLIIDTGATKSILSHRDAQTIAGMRLSRQTVGTMRTLGGDRRYRVATVDRTRIGSQDIGPIEFAIIEPTGSVSVIGQDILGQLGPIILDGDRMTLR